MQRFLGTYTFICNDFHYTGMGASTETSVSRQVCVRLPKDMAEQLDEISETAPYEVPKSEIVRTALREHLDE
jgi:hypothetical protein